MGRVVWMALNPYFVFFHVLFPIIIIIALVIPSILPRITTMIISTLTLTYITAMLYVLLRRNPVVGVLFTEDGLVVHSARGFTVARNMVVTGNVVCIRKTPRGIRLRIRHGSLDYTIPLDQIQYEALINALTTHWGWIPPECPSN
ncbi:hypothetical protein B7L70_04785 [Vulcanisaeta sp. EB80]|uniref:hypothetical protein n=1 Tax=Vulcanisaeta sp. EB80 TaxID=1650660 RepID=UPI0009BDF9B3|nr:hypothetical protein [Vulcanisaeta sp. EB80]PLC68155.1 hypothetical protein B7L70_04785 [Vulcanisaeta sp. EB80]